MGWVGSSKAFFCDVRQVTGPELTPSGPSAGPGQGAGSRLRGDFCEAFPLAEEGARAAAPPQTPQSWEGVGSLAVAGMTGLVGSRALSLYPPHGQGAHMGDVTHL